jgi:hypothetical protein
VNRRFPAVLSFCLAMAVIGHSPASGRSAEQIQYSCDDVVVVARITNNFDYEHVEIEDDILGHGWMTGTLNVIEHLRGPSPRLPVKIRYFAHTWRRFDGQFLLVLHRDPDAQEYRIQLAHALRRNDDTELADRCSPNLREGDA